MKPLEKNNILSRHQHGFCARRSCFTVFTHLFEYLEELKMAIDQHEYVDSIYLDCRKAFDTVPHKRLIVKLRVARVRDCILKWIEAFLNGRQQRVVARGESSNWREL